MKEGKRSKEKNNEKDNHHPYLIVISFKLDKWRKNILILQLRECISRKLLVETDLET